MAELQSTTSSKVFALPGMAAEAVKLRRQNKRLVLTPGVFDLLHPGHLVHLRFAKAQGDILVISLTGDRFVFKGPGRPAFGEGTRAEMLAALELVDYIVIQESLAAVPVIEALRPDVLVFYGGYEDKDDPALSAERKAAALWGARVCYSPREKVGSSTELVRNLVPLLSPEQNAFLNNIRGKTTVRQFERFCLEARNLAPLVIGEVIVDEYIYIEPVGASRKDSLIVFSERQRASWAGGAAVVWANLKEVCPGVKLLTPNGHKVIKRRWVQLPYLTKRFSVFQEQGDLAAWEPDVANIDAAPFVVVADFGHGLIDFRKAALIAAKAKHLALTVQANAANYGFNLLSKYPRAAYICADEGEYRLVSREQFLEAGALLRSQQRAMGAKLAMMTIGHRGALAVGTKDALVDCPAFGGLALDTLGAGDAFLAYTAPFAYLDAPIELVALIGCVASGLAAAKVGNEPVPFLEVQRTVKALME